MLGPDRKFHLSKNSAWRYWQPFLVVSCSVECEVCSDYWAVFMLRYSVCSVQCIVFFSKFLVGSVHLFGQWAVCNVNLIVFSFVYTL